MEYTKQNFKSGQILTAEALNNMDSSLESAVNELNNKQEKITDGSIPLSALSEEIKNQIGSSNKKIAWENIQYSPFGISAGATGNCNCTFLKNENDYHYYLITAYDDYIIQIVKSDSGFTKYHDPLKKGYFILVMSDDAQRPDCQIDIVSTIYDDPEYKVTIRIKNTEKEWVDGEGIDIISILKSTTYSLPKSCIPQLPAIYVESDNPDWNAQKGEVGYIKNRTHSVKIINPVVDSDNLIEYSWNTDYNKLYMTYFSNLGYNKTLYLPHGDPIIISGNDFFEITNYSIDIEWDGDSSIRMVFPEGGANNFANIFMQYLIVGEYVQLSDAFIPETVIKTTPQTLSDDDKNQVKENLGISEPNWNAKEDEVGYIKNKPFEFIDKHENAFYYDASVNPNYIIWDEPSATESSTIQILDYDGVPQYISLNDKTDGFLNNMDHIFNLYNLNYKWLNSSSLGIEISSDILDNGEDVSSYLNNLINYSTGGILRKISDAFLPDTVVKTTPQTLTDTDKNQVLANLGIDPIVWKYICNPHIVEFDRINAEFNNAIPKELSDIIYQNGKFNQLILSTVLIKIYEESEGGDVFWRVERITSYNNYGNVIFDREEFGYDTDTRLFLV